MQVSALWRFANDAPDLAGPLEHGLTFGAHTALAGTGRVFVIMQQLVPDLAVVQFGGRGVLIGNIPPAESEANYCAALVRSDMTA